MGENTYQSERLYIYKTYAEENEKPGISAYCCCEKHFVVESVIGGYYYYIKVKPPLLSEAIVLTRALKSSVKKIVFKR